MNFKIRDQNWFRDSSRPPSYRCHAGQPCTQPSDQPCTPPRHQPCSHPSDGSSCQPCSQPRAPLTVRLCPTLSYLRNKVARLDAASPACMCNSATNIKQQNSTVTPLFPQKSDVHGDAAFGPAKLAASLADSQAVSLALQTDNHSCKIRHAKKEMQSMHAT